MVTWEEEGLVCLKVSLRYSPDGSHRTPAGIVGAHAEN
jgi:hypothetical protein